MSAPRRPPPDEGPQPPDWRQSRRESARRQARRRRRVAAGVVVLAVAAVAVGVWAVVRSGSSSPAPRPEPARTQAAVHPAPARPHRPAFEKLTFAAHPARASVRVPVLMFHRVAGEDTVTNAVSRDLTITPERFAAELAWLAEHGYHPIRLGTLFRALEDGGPLPAKPVVLSFDDGYVDDAPTIAPLLRRRRWPAAFFVITGRAGARAFLTWPQIRRLDRMGMDVGSHTVDHVELPGLTADGRRQELVASRAALERHLGHPVYWFAYPAGAWDTTSATDARSAGYLLAFTTDPGSDQSSTTPLSEPRVRIHGADGLDAFAAAVSAASGPA
jgi:peptidoglycan/xylan/chitin deacetylase (PgdA/CDA1 family)